MNTAVDTSVLIAIAKGESDAEAWVQLLAAQSARGDLVICEIVAGEFFALPLDDEKFKAAIQTLGIQFSPANEFPDYNQKCQPPRCFTASTL